MMVTCLAGGTNDRRMSTVLLFGQYRTPQARECDACAACHMIAEFDRGRVLFCSKAFRYALRRVTIGARVCVCVCMRVCVGRCRAERRVCCPRMCGAY